MSLLALLMVVAGVAHLARPQPFVDIVPSFLPVPLVLVYVSGVFEILGGVGLLVPRSRRFAAWGLIALYVAVFPANINMALHHIVPTGTRPWPEWAFWARLPLQIGLIAWAHSFTRGRRSARNDPRA